MSTRIKAELKLIVGLGNPGAAYKRTRHNTGALTVERLARKTGLTLKPNSSFKSLSAIGGYAGRTVILFLPQTFMNLSGEAVAGIVRKKHIAPSDILVVYDDVALPFGEIRLKASGGSGGHNGMVSVIERLGTKDFARLKLGIGSEGAAGNLSDYVLSKFNKNEQVVLGEMLEKAADAIEVWATQGIDAAMNCFNIKTKGKKT
ncbi:MAG: aminoacyl-tRNA hydrolase [Candidatus Omnitrophica bacterium]|nr:aminoacyl-tRNA hydrolase [Candidatus Omnitrophota bacterium]